MTDVVERLRRLSYEWEIRSLAANEREEPIGEHIYLAVSVVLLEIAETFEHERALGDAA